MDCIRLTGIRCYGYVGYLPEEQVLGQWFEVDVNLWLDLTQVSQSDAIEDTLDYRQTISLVQNLVKTSKFALLERLAGAIADAILDNCNSTGATSRGNYPINQVQVIVSKPAAPIPDFNGRISIEITRRSCN